MSASRRGAALLLAGAIARAATAATSDASDPPPPNGASSPAAQNAASNRAERNAASALLAVDAAFSADAQKLGVAEAFVRYAAPDARMLPEGKDVVSGIDAVRRQMAGFPTKATLSWKPFHADVAASGELGYTLGTYEFRATDEAGKPSVSHGKYCSIWKKQSDGKWKWVVDVGTKGPEPARD